MSHTGPITEVISAPALGPLELDRSQPTSAARVASRSCTGPGSCTAAEVSLFDDLVGAGCGASGLMLDTDADL
jgi:hypothetical protein